MSANVSEQADLFELFGLPRRYEVDPSALDAAYEQLSVEYHPDFFANAPEEEQRRIQRLSTRINEGYRTLRSERARARYLLGLLAEGIELDAQSLPPGFLQEMFSLQEEVDELDEDDDPERRAALQQQTREQMDAVLAERGRLFAEALEQPGPETLQAIQTNINCERYLQRLADRLENPGHEREL